MKLTLSPTSTFVDLNGTRTRIWVGTNEAGVQHFAYVARVALSTTHHHYQLETDLHNAPPAPRCHDHLAPYVTL